MKVDRPILFFDGTCNLCNTMIDLVVALDKKNQIYKAPLQGKTAEELVPEDYRKNMRTLILYREGKMAIRSAAIFELAFILKGPLLLITPFWLLPRFITDSLYRLVARYRYRLFGQRNSVRTPSDKKKHQFLD